MFSAATWEQIAPLIISLPHQNGSTGRDKRMHEEGGSGWRTRSPCRDLPEALGACNSVFRRFSRWSIKGVWAALRGDVR